MKGKNALPRGRLVTNVRVRVISKVSSMSTEQAQGEGREHGQEGDGDVL